MANDRKQVVPEPQVPRSIEEHPAWYRLIDQENWYDEKSKNAQAWYKRLKTAQFTSAALIPATSLLPSELAKWAASAFGVLIAVLEAVQQMNQFSALWYSYRATAERLKHEKYLFLSGAGPYKSLVESERLVTLAERVEEHVSTEHANWFNETRHAVAETRPEGK